MSTPQQPINVPSVPIVRGVSPQGMIPAEAALLTIWLQQHAGEYDTFSFNVRVGNGQDPGPQYTEDVRRAMILNSQRRIDCLLTKGLDTLIIEVKVRGSLWAIGQLEGYSVLWLRDNPGKSVPKLMLLCMSIDADTAYAYSILGIPYQLVTPPS